MKLENAARGQPCYMRLPSICTFDDEQTVLCHIRRGNVAGVGMKPTSLAAIPMCARCHDAYDGRGTNILSQDDLDADALRALVQWLHYLDRKGLVTVK